MPVYDSFYEKQLLAASYCVTCIIGVISNTVVLLAVVLSRKPRTTTNVFVVNLAVTDLLTCLFLPVMILGLLSESREELLVSPTLCTVAGFFLVTSNPCSFNAIAFIALHRASVTCRLKKPYLRNLFSSARGLLVMIAFIWMIPLTVSFFPILSDFGAFGYDENFSSCSFRPTSPLSHIYATVLIATSYPLQLCVTSASYVAIFTTIIRGSRRVNDHNISVVGGEMRYPRPRSGQVDGSMPQSSSQDSASRGPPAPSRGPGRRPPPRLGGNPHLALRNRKITLNMLLVVVAFAACTAPYCICIGLLKDRNQKFVPFLGSLLVFNSCINPVIYMARHPDFKQVCRCILFCRLSKIPMKSALLRRFLDWRSG